MCYHAILYFLPIFLPLFCKLIVKQFKFLYQRNQRLKNQVNVKQNTFSSRLLSSIFRKLFISSSIWNSKKMCQVIKHSEQYPRQLLFHLLVFNSSTLIFSCCSKNSYFALNSEFFRRISEGKQLNRKTWKIVGKAK